MKLSAFVAIAAVIGGSFIAPNPAEAQGCYPALIVDDMNQLVMEGKNLNQSWQEQIKLGNSNGSDYCWRQTKSYLRSYGQIKPALFNAVFK